MKKKFHPAAWSFRSRARPSKTLSRSISRIGLAFKPQHLLHSGPVFHRESRRLERLVASVKFFPSAVPILARYASKNCSKVTILAATMPCVCTGPDQERGNCAASVHPGTILGTSCPLNNSRKRTADSTPDVSSPPSARGGKSWRSRKSKRYLRRGTRQMPSSMCKKAK